MGFSHLALLVPNVEKSAAFLNAQGIETQDPETFESEGSKEIYVGDYETQSGLLLLVEGISEGPYQRAMAKRGPSVHHFALDVLNIEDFAAKAQKAGWKLHPISKETISHKTVWLYVKGLPLIEAHQKKQLSSKPTQISKIELPILKEQLPLFEAIGLKNQVGCGSEISLQVDDLKIAFASLK